LQKSYELIKHRLGGRRAEQWLDDYLGLVQLTHWILPYPTDTLLVGSTKTRRNSGLASRTMWFSSVYADPGVVQLPFEPSPNRYPKTLHTMLRRAFRRGGGVGDVWEHAWGTRRLLWLCKSGHMEIYGEAKAREYWIAGRTSRGTKGCQPVWERSIVPRLRMHEDCRERTLEELDEFMAGLAVEHSGVEANMQDVQRQNDVGAQSYATDSTRRRVVSIADVFRRTQGSVESGSVYQPSSGS